VNGVFATIDGPGGAGKSTTMRRLCRRLAEQGYAVHSTTEPSHGQLGEMARHGTDVYSGHALACLVAADRYHHLVTEIRPKLAAGYIVVCDRYVASSYVLQRMDGVPIDFIEAINAAADVPDLAVVLTADPMVTADRINRRGAHSRFEAGMATSRTEAELYEDTLTRLSKGGYPLMTIDTGRTPVARVSTMIATRIAQLAGVPHSDSTTA
jgi:dTMP kinase